MAVILVPNGGFQTDRLFGDLHHFAHFFQRHRELFGQFFGRWFAADFVQHLARGPHQLVDGFNHMHRDTDGARLISDRAGNRLSDPPGRIGREFIAPAVFKLVHRLHQANIAFLNKIQELQTTIGVFFGDRDHQPQIGLNHFFFGLCRFALTFLYGFDDDAKLINGHPCILRQLTYQTAQTGNLVRFAINKFFPGR